MACLKTPSSGMVKQYTVYKKKQGSPLIKRAAPLTV